MKVNLGFTNAIPLNFTSKEVAAKEKGDAIHELAALKTEVGNLRQTVFQLLKSCDSSKQVTGQPEDNSIYEKDPDFKRRERVAIILKRHFAQMDIAAGLYEYDWFNYSLELMGKFYLDTRKGDEFHLPPHLLDCVCNDVIRVDDDPDSETNPNYKGYRLNMGVWSWGRRNKLLNYLINNAHEQSEEEWRTLDKKDYALTGTLSLGDSGSKLGSV